MDFPRKRQRGEFMMPEVINRDLVSLSHLFAASSVAPWVSREEWLSVYSELKLVLTNPENPMALRGHPLDKVGKIIDSCWCKAWGSRNEAAQTTIILLQALRALRENHSTAVLSAQMAVIRFVKTIAEHIIARHTERPTIIKVCKLLGVPDWIVRIRHDSSHGEMQDKGELDQALCFSLRWMKRNFWDVEEKRIQNPSYMVKSANEETDNPTRSEMEDVIENELRGVPRKIDLLRAGMELRMRHNTERQANKLSQKEREQSWAITREIEDLEYYRLHLMDSFAGILASRFLAPSEVPAHSLVPGNSDIEPSALSDLSRARHEELVGSTLSCPMGTHHLLLHLAKLISDHDHERAELATAWMVFVLNRVPRNKVSAVRIWDAFNWRKVVEEVIAKPSKHMEFLLKKLPHWTRNRHDRGFLEDCRRLTSVLKPQNQLSSLDAPVRIVAELVEDLGSKGGRIVIMGNVAETKKLDVHAAGPSGKPTGSGSRNPWSLADNVDWTGVPLGILPWQNKPGVNFYELLLVQEERPTDICI